MSTLEEQLANLVNADQALRPEAKYGIPVGREPLDTGPAQYATMEDAPVPVWNSNTIGQENNVTPALFSNARTQAEYAADYAQRGEQYPNRGFSNGIPVSNLSVPADPAQLANQPTLWEAFMASDKSPNTPSQAELMANPSLFTPAMARQQQAQGGGTSSTGGAGGPMVNTPTVGGGQGDAVSRLQAARQPRGLTFSNLFGSTGFDPETGQFTTTESPEYAQFQQGLLGQLQGAQSAYQSFNPQDAAAEYLQGVNALREPLREQQTQSALSRLVQSGKLGATAGTQALAQLESAQENQRFQEGVQAQQYGQQQQQQMLANQAGLFGLAGQVAQQQFQPQQQALGAVPLLQEIYSFPEEPAFQQSLAQQALNAQKSANQSGMFGDIFGMIAPKLFGL